MIVGRDIAHAKLKKQSGTR
ncbi:hypothetical protein ACLB1S_15990 [Escherichia coli]